MKSILNIFLTRSWDLFLALSSAFISMHIVGANFTESRYDIQDILEEEGSFNVAGRGNVHLPTIGNIYTYWLIGRKEWDGANDPSIVMTI